MNNPSRDAEKGKAITTTQQKGKATQHNLPETAIFQRKIGCLGWDSNPQPYTCTHCWRAGECTCKIRSRYVQCSSHIIARSDGSLWLPNMVVLSYAFTVEPLYSGHPWEWHFGCYTEVAVVEGFYTGVKLNRDQGYSRTSVI